MSLIHYYSSVYLNIRTDRVLYYDRNLRWNEYGRDRRGIKRIQNECVVSDTGNISIQAHA